VFAALARRKALAIALAGLIPLAGHALLLRVLPVPNRPFKTSSAICSPATPSPPAV
jgi:hypothetical protein